MGLQELLQRLQQILPKAFDGALGGGSKLAVLGSGCTLLLLIGFHS